MVPHPRVLRGALRDSFGTPLSPREDELMRLFADGATTAEAAFAAGMSYHTAKNHISSILARYGARSTTQAVGIWARAVPR